jgi:hypothetical protein
MTKKLRFLALLTLALAGCAARKARSVSVPGCQDAYAAIPAGCYAQKFSDRVEVRCPQITNTYFCHRAPKR